MAIEYIGKGAPDGTVVFQSGEKGGFFGLAAAVTQPTGATAVATTASTTTTPYGFTTAAQADAIVAAVNQFRTILNSLGLCTTV